MKAIQVRVARPTLHLKKIIRFYSVGLGLPILGQFEDHLGYDGVMLGLPDANYHLEFTQHRDVSVLPEPTKEHLLVLYYDSPAEYIEANERLRAFGVEPVTPENPYWMDKSTTFEDPDGWRVVLYNGVYMA